MFVAARFCVYKRHFFFFSFARAPSKRVSSEQLFKSKISMLICKLIYFSGLQQYCAMLSKLERSRSKSRG